MELQFPAAPYLEGRGGVVGEGWRGGVEVGIGRGWRRRGWSGRRAWGGVGEGMGVREKFGVDAKTLIVVCTVNSIGH